MYICLACGDIFDEDEIAIWKEDRGEYWGTPCYETVSGCPRCKSNYTETYRCSRCEEWIEGDYIKIDGNRYCEHCYDKYELGEE